MEINEQELYELFIEAMIECINNDSVDCIYFEEVEEETIWLSGELYGDVSLDNLPHIWLSSEVSWDMPYDYKLVVNGYCIAQNYKEDLEYELSEFALETIANDIACSVIPKWAEENNIELI